MTMPKWHECMRPVLVALNDGEIHTSAELQEAMVKTFSMTEEEQAERLKSGQLRMYNRLYWAISDLEKAKLVAYGEKRGTYTITQLGTQFLASHDASFTDKELYDECTNYKAWKDGYQAKKDGKTASSTRPVLGDNSSSPEESMETANAELRDALAVDLLQAIMQQSPTFFEYLVGKLLEAMGYGVSLDHPTTVTAASGDEGIDGIVKEDRLGFDKVYYQAKRWNLDRTVSRPDIQAFVGALSGKGASKGLFITTANFSKGAREYAEGIHSQRLVLVDGKTLANLMMDYGVGVSTKSTYKVLMLDSDFFA